MSLSARGDAASIAKTNGRLAKPASTGLQPQANWNCCEVPYIVPTMASMTAVWMRALTRTVGRASRLRSTIGLAALRSRR